jgi:FixJ family two-component response regulator
MAPRLREPVTSKKPLITIVDDDDSVCRALERLVRSFGMVAETYRSGADFIQQIESLSACDADCVVLDVQMPGLNGIEVQARLRRVRKDIPVVFITAHDDRVARERALAGGALAFLQKPCNDVLLMRTLDTALGRRKTGEPPGPTEGGE